MALQYPRQLMVLVNRNTVALVYGNSQVQLTVNFH